MKVGEGNRAREKQVELVPRAPTCTYSLPLVEKLEPFYF